ncbi:hypothetical protein GCM10023156_60550 [Novipirellula rosea]|uniref:Uncharacterized protein n=1 Tax=Novipirellula rosea TaxID=1031540 RepID=A0ABP8NKU0_9BACT
MKRRCGGFCRRGAGEREQNRCQSQQGAGNDWKTSVFGEQCEHFFSAGGLGWVRGGDRLGRKVLTRNEIEETGFKAEKFKVRLENE